MKQLNKWLLKEGHLNTLIKSEQKNSYQIASRKKKLHERIIKLDKEVVMPTAEEEEAARRYFMETYFHLYTNRGAFSYLKDFQLSEEEKKAYPLPQKQRVKVTSRGVKHLVMGEQGVYIKAIEEFLE